MSFTQDFFTSRRNQADGSSRLGDEGRIWYDSISNSLRIGDGITPGGRAITSSVTSTNIGNLVITGTTIETLGVLEPITIKADTGGDINLIGNIHMHGNSIFYDKAEFHGGVLLASPTHSTSNVLIDGTLVTVGTTRAIGNFTANGTSSLIGNVIMSGTTETIGTGIVQGTFTANGLSSLIGNVIMSGTTLTLGTSQVNGVFTANGTSALIGNVIMSGTTLTLGTSQVNGVFTANGTSALIGNVYISGNSSVQGSFTANGTSLLVGNTTVLGLMSHTGDTIFVGHVEHTGNLDVNGHLAITKDTTIIGNLTVTGQSTYIGNVNTVGASFRTGALFVNGPLVIDGTTTVNNQLMVTGTGNIKFNDNTIQTTAAIEYITNGGHLTGAFVYAGIQRGLNLTSDATPINTPNTIVSRGATGNIAVGDITASTINTTVIGGNNSIAGSMVIYGNLQVLGTTTTVSANVLVIDSKVLIVSNSAVTGSQADGSGIQVGNATVFADFLYDNDQKAWRSDVSLIPKVDCDGNVGSDTRHWNTVHANYGHLSTALYVGPEPTNSINALSQFTGNINDYAELYAQNINSGNVASTDYIATADNGDAISNYIDMGINSSTYNNPAYSISSANDGYLYVNGGDLAVGTQTPGTDVVFHTDGTLSANEAGRIHLGRWLLGGAVDDGSNRVQISDGLRVVGNITAGNVNAFNITSIATSVTTANTAMKGYVDAQDTAITNAWTANAGVQAGAITTANTAMKGYVDAQDTAITNAWTANAGVQAGQISSIQSNVTTLQGQVYSNVNVAAYLPTYSGNLTAGNITATTKFYGNVNGTATQLATAATAIGTFLAGKLSAATGSIPKNSVATVTYTITGLTTNHKIIMSPGTVMPDRQFSVTAAWASATNTVSIEYANNTGGAISATLDINYFAFV